MLDAPVIVKDFTCETNEAYDRYAEVLIDCRLLLAKMGVSIDEVKQARIREAIKRAVIEAVAIEAPARKEAANG